MIAEMAAAFLCARLGIAAEPHPDHARYIGHWLTVMKADSRAVFTAAAKASGICRAMSGGRSSMMK